MEWLALDPGAQGVAGRWMPVLAMVTAMGVDRHFGEPPLRWHPVVWMGRLLDWCAPWVLSCKAAQRVDGYDLAAGTRGAAAWCAIAILVLSAAWGVQFLLTEAAAASPAAIVVAAVLTGLVLKPLLAWRMLHAEVQAVEAALAVSLEDGRARLAHLASRDARRLQAAEVREAAIESLAENLNDSVVAPLFWFLLAGLPGAALYRFANTADAMWGYPGERHGRNWAWAGKWAARADDVLSWLPARLTALVLALAAGRAWLPGLYREARRTPSPNSGWPMAAMALALGLRLRKPAVYVLNPAGREPVAMDTGRALDLAGNALWFAMAMFSVAMVLAGPGGLQ